MNYEALVIGGLFLFFVLAYLTNFRQWVHREGPEQPHEGSRPEDGDA